MSSVQEMVSTGLTVSISGQRNAGFTPHISYQSVSYQDGHLFSNRWSTLVKLTQRKQARADMQERDLWWRLSSKLRSKCDELRRRLESLSREADRRGDHEAADAIQESEDEYSRVWSSRLGQ